MENIFNRIWFPGNRIMKNEMNDYGNNNKNKSTTTIQYEQRLCYIIIIIWYQSNL